MRVALIRHGDFEEGEDNMNAAGIEQISGLALKLKDLGSPKIFSSQGPRSKETAKIIADSMGVTFQPLVIFGTDSRQDQTELFHRALDYLKGLNTNTIIVSKGEYLDDFLPYFAKSHYNQNISNIKFKRGQAVVVSESGYKLFY